MVEESPPAMLSILKALADRPGEWLTSHDLAAAIGRKADWKTVAGTLGAFGRRCKNRYKMSLPIERRFDHQINVKVCRMNDEMARLIKSFMA
jgi:hypothetical protein